MSDETRKTSAMLGGVASVLAILTFLGKGIMVAMDVHSDLNAMRHDLNNAIRKLDRIEDKIDKHDDEISRLKAKVGIVQFNQFNQAGETR